MFCLSFNIVLIHFNIIIIVLNTFEVLLCVRNYICVTYSQSYDLNPTIYWGRGAVISVKQHSDKKLLEWYAKDSERVYRCLLIEFINEKWNYVIMQNDQMQTKSQNVFVNAMVKFSFIRVYSMFILYEADGLWCRTVQYLEYSDLSSRCLMGNLCWHSWFKALLYIQFVYIFLSEHEISF